MPWFKVDDGFAFHPKAGAAGNAAIGLWVRAGSWCAQQLTDGEVPREFLRVLGGRPRDAKALVDVGLWDATDKGWRFHDWSEFQPSREQIRAERRSGAARQKVARSPELRAAIRERDEGRCRYCGREVSWTDRRGSHGGTYDHVIPDGPSDLENLVVCCRGCNASKGHRTPEQAGMPLIQLRPKSGSKSDVGADPSATRPPTRPDPTRPVVPIGTTGDGARKRATRLPSDWAISQDLCDWAVDQGYSPPFVMAENAKFIDYWNGIPGQKGTKLDWPGTWRNWIRRAAENHRPNTGRSTPDPVGRLERTLQRVAERQNTPKELPR